MCPVLLMFLHGGFCPSSRDATKRKGLVPIVPTHKLCTSEIITNVIQYGSLHLNQVLLLMLWISKHRGSFDQKTVFLTLSALGWQILNLMSLGLVLIVRVWPFLLFPFSSWSSAEKNCDQVKWIAATVSGGVQSNGGENREAFICSPQFLLY